MIESLRLAPNACMGTGLTICMGTGLTMGTAIGSLGSRTGVTIIRVPTPGPSWLAWVTISWLPIPGPSCVAWAIIPPWFCIAAGWLPWGCGTGWCGTAANSLWSWSCGRLNSTNGGRLRQWPQKTTRMPSSRLATISVTDSLITALRTSSRKTV